MEGKKVLGWTKVRCLLSRLDHYDAPELGLVVVGLFSLRTGAELGPEYHTLDKLSQRQKRNDLEIIYLRSAWPEHVH